MRKISKLEPMKENIITAYVDYKQPIARIAITYNVSAGTISTKLREWGVVMRSKGRPRITPPEAKGE